MVLGANSFSGSHFVKFALDRGHSVTGVSRSPEPDYCFLPRLWGESPGRYSFSQLDVNSHFEDLKSLIVTTQPSVVVNFAAQGMVAQSWETPWDWFHTNTVGLSRVLAAVSESKALQKYVHVSTPEVYGSTKGWIKESFVFAPSTPYATSRAAGDWHVMNMMKTRGFPAVLTRAANVYGPGQQLYRLIPRAFLSGMLSESFPLDGDGSSTRSFIHISDVVDATYRLALNDIVGQSFHISTKELVSIRSLIRMIDEELGDEFPIRIENLPERDGKDQTYQLESSALRDTTGWSDSVSLNEGLGEVKRWVKENLDTLAKLPRSYVHKV